MASHDYDFSDFLRTSHLGFRLYKNNFTDSQGASQAYQVCGDRLLVLSACLRLLDEQGSVENGLFVGNVQAQVNKYVPRIGDFRTTIEELGALIRENNENGRPWEAIVGEDLSELEKLSAAMKKQSRSIHNILVLDRTMDVHRALEILGHEVRRRPVPVQPVIEMPIPMPTTMSEQMANLGLTDGEGRFRTASISHHTEEETIVSPASPRVLQMPNQKESSIWGTGVKYIGMGIGIHNGGTSRSHRRPSNNQAFYGIHRTNSMSNSSDTGRSQSGSSSRNNSTQTLDSQENGSPAHSPTYYVSHTGSNARDRERERDKVRFDEIAQISGMRIQPSLSSRGSSDSPTNLSADFVPNSPPIGSGLPYQGAGSMRIPRRPVSSTGSAGSASNTGLHPLITPSYQPLPLYESGSRSPRETSLPRQRDSSYSDGSTGQSSESGRPSHGSSSYFRDSSAGPSSRTSDPGPFNPPLRRDSDITTIISPPGHRGSESSSVGRSHPIDFHDSFARISRNNSYAIAPDVNLLSNDPLEKKIAANKPRQPYLDLPFSPDTLGTDLLIRGQRPPSIASKDSKGEENLKPGEALIYNGSPETSNTVEGRYDPSEIRVYRNSITDVYRFVTTVLGNPSAPISHSQHFRSRELEIIPEYGYDPLARPVLWLREVEDVNKSRRPLEIMPEKEIPAIPSLRFRDVPQMLDFQAALLGEICYLDIETVRFVRLKGAAKETRRIDNTRVQLWHPAPNNKRTIDDSASFVTVGTSRTHANPDIMRLKWSRMMVYLGRSNDFVTVFITDDITLRQSKKGNTLVFEPTKYTGRALFKSRDGVKAKVVGGGRKKGGMRLDMKGLAPDDEENFPMFKTFEIEFEDAESQVRFISVWDQLIQERRRMRGVIDKRRRQAEERFLLGGGGN
ncbi:hypothetical protein TWF569_011593 [Orbilia oligospora]|uniref:Uncharacterized protein n=1 Tax=Orbilia oligospora TaxID=2813651 RepID=A0A7C8NS13_ORBOL|nr:hypothetical protein TWF706_010261 [Orbilia oligospora]KAF3094733.1 hypothetical protein TWF102_007523 [Orbilia oligospora]KAF3094763.1 hypothetical protein TWF103_010473 [Orbilia oligospora]KAF3130703.1 hypothetical protein TWF569_011593 [Orbilia oligospora]KAF3133081.1 hypothetical protein TWF594_009297 [Orbilia oligospora]